jgi:hypothetical protein
MKKTVSGLIRSKTSHTTQYSKNTDAVKRQSLWTEAFRRIKRQEQNCYSLWSERVFNLSTGQAGTQCAVRDMGFEKDRLIYQEM